MAGNSKDPNRKRRHAVSDYERQQIRQYKKQNPGLTNQDVANWAGDKFGRKIDLTIVHRAMDHKYKSLDGKRIKKNDYLYSRGGHEGYWPELEAALFEWHMRMQADRHHVNGPVLQAMADKLWGIMPQYQSAKRPPFSNGWLEGYKRRHGVKSYNIFGEAASANTSPEAERRMEELRALCQEYDSVNILNMDETGLFWKSTPGKTLATEQVSGKKKEKDRITIAVTCNADGSEYYPLWIIGRSQNPRCFKKGVATRGLNFHYRFNSKKWMTTAIFLEYLKWLDKRVQFRNCLLLVDGFSAHEAGVKAYIAQYGSLKNLR